MGIESFFLFALGLAIGSFLNVVVYRLNHNLSPFQGRSFCPKCRKKILWQDNIPLLSFILLKGKCRFCHSPISWQYPLVELATAFLTVFVANYYFSVFNLFFTYVLIALFTSDLNYYTLPDKIIYPTIILTLIFKGVSGLLAGLTGAGFFLFLVWLTRGKGMGLGDVKMACLMGLILGWRQLLVALYLAFLTGALAGVILILLGKKRFGEHVPFGPFLAGATWISLFFGEKIWFQIGAALL